MKFVFLLLLPFAASAQPSKRMADGKRWTIRNLDVTVSQSYCYDEADTNCRKYGRLYTWESAPRACQALGRGWRLPTDDEWRHLAQAFAAMLGGGRARCRCGALKIDDQRYHHATQNIAI